MLASIGILLFTGVFSSIVIGFNLQRDYGVYLLQIYVPTALTVVMSWLSFWIHHEAIAARVALGITTVLTVSTLMTSFRAVLPQVPYLKEIEWFTCICFGYVVAALFEFVLVHYLTKAGKNAAAPASQVSRVVASEGGRGHNVIKLINQFNQLIGIHFLLSAFSDNAAGKKKDKRSSHCLLQ